MLLLLLFFGVNINAILVLLYTERFFLRERDREGDGVFFLVCLLFFLDTILMQILVRFYMMKMKDTL